MLHRYNRCFQSLHGVISYAPAIYLKHKLFYSTKKSSKRHEEEPHSPQAEFAEMWETTTDDKISHLSRELRKSSLGKKMAVFGSLSALMCGKMGWYQFEFLGMPTEMEFVMLYLPVTFLAIHWSSWYFNMNGIYKQMSFKLPANWKKNEGLIGGSKPEYHQLVDMHDASNLVLLDEWSKQLKRHRILCAGMCAVNMTFIMLTGTMNPFGDPALDALDPLNIGLYSLYPLVSYAFSIVVYGSPMKDIPQWKQEIVEELGIVEDDETENKDT